MTMMPMSRSVISKPSPGWIGREAWYRISLTS
jgi:hypothetical protein